MWSYLAGYITYTNGALTAREESPISTGLGEYLQKTTHGHTITHPHG